MAIASSPWPVIVVGPIRLVGSVDVIDGSFPQVGSFLSCLAPQPARMD